MIRDAWGHHGRLPERQVNAAEIVVHEVERHGMREVSDLLREAVR